MDSTLEEVERLAADLEREFSQGRPEESTNVSSASTSRRGGKWKKTQNNQNHLPLQAQAPRGISFNDVEAAKLLEPNDTVNLEIEDDHLNEGGTDEEEDENKNSIQNKTSIKQNNKISKNDEEENDATQLINDYESKLAWEKMRIWERMMEFIKKHGKEFTLDLFKEFDLDEDGKLNFFEFRSALGIFGFIDLNDDVVQAVIVAANLDNELVMSSTSTSSSSSSSSSASEAKLVDYEELCSKLINKKHHDFLSPTPKKSTMHINKQTIPLQDTFSSALSQSVPPPQDSSDKIGGSGSSEDWQLIEDKEQHKNADESAMDRDQSLSPSPTKLLHESVEDAKEAIRLTQEAMASSQKHVEEEEEGVLVPPKDQPNTEKTKGRVSKVVTAPLSPSMQQVSTLSPRSAPPPASTMVLEDYEQPMDLVNSPIMQQMEKSNQSAAQLEKLPDKEIFEPVGSDDDLASDSGGEAEDSDGKGGSSEYSDGSTVDSLTDVAKIGKKQSPSSPLSPSSSNQLQPQNIESKSERIGRRVPTPTSPSHNVKKTASQNSNDDELSGGGSTVDNVDDDDVNQIKTQSHIDDEEDIEKQKAEERKRAKEAKQKLMNAKLAAAQRAMDPAQHSSQNKNKKNEEEESKGVEKWVRSRGSSFETEDQLLKKKGSLSSSSDDDSDEEIGHQKPFSSALEKATGIKWGKDGKGGYVRIETKDHDDGKAMKDKSSIKSPSMKSPLGKRNSHSSVSPTKRSGAPNTPRTPSRGGAGERSWWEEVKTPANKPIGENDGLGNDEESNNLIQKEGGDEDSGNDVDEDGKVKSEGICCAEGSSRTIRKFAVAMLLLFPLVYIGIMVYLCQYTEKWGTFIRRTRHPERPSFSTVVFIMPCAGFLAALVSNVVPLSGGLIFAPVLHVLNVTGPKSTLPFCAIMQLISNGYLGFFNNLARDPSRIVFNAFPFVVIPAWIGTAIGLTRKYTANEAIFFIHVEDKFRVTFFRALFSLFSLCMAIFIFRVHSTGIDNWKFKNAKRSPCNWLKVAIVSFFTGYTLVANIGVGLTVVSFLTLSIFIGIDPLRAIPTAVICGGWTAAFPVFLNALMMDQVPVLRVLITIPGTFAGALFAPPLARWIGRQRVMLVHGIFLILSSIAMASLVATAFVNDGSRLYSGPIFNLHSPTMEPSLKPTHHPAIVPSGFPSIYPTGYPSFRPSHSPISAPTSLPSPFPWSDSSLPRPTAQPGIPSLLPTISPRKPPPPGSTYTPTMLPSAAPSPLPTLIPSPEPTGSCDDMGANFWPIEFRGIRTISNIDVDWARVYHTDELSNSLFKHPMWVEGGLWTLRLIASSTCSHSLSFGFAHGGGFLIFDIPGQAEMKHVGVVDLLGERCEESYLQAVTSCEDEDPAYIILDELEALPGHCQWKPTLEPTPYPTSTPTSLPSSIPSPLPTQLPSLFVNHSKPMKPTSQPVSQPTSKPTLPPPPTMQPNVFIPHNNSSQPFSAPTSVPTLVPSVAPTNHPTLAPSYRPSQLPSSAPSMSPSYKPSENPSSLPSLKPSITPTSRPTNKPSQLPTIQPTNKPSQLPTNKPTNKPSEYPTSWPSIKPSFRPTNKPSVKPSSTSPDSKNTPTVQPQTDSGESWEDNLASLLSGVSN